MSRGDGRRPAGDDGFTLVEVLVAVAIIAVVMLGLGAVFVASAAGTDAQGARQAAVRVATDGLDRVRALPGSGLATALPTTAETVTVDGLAYRRSYTVTPCALTSAATCAATASTGTVPMSSVTVTVTWVGRGCAGNRCSYQLSTLVDAGTVDPVFDVSDVAPAPVLDAVADVTQDTGEKVTGPVLTAVGGSGTLTYAATGLPAGVAMSAAGALTGTLTAVTSGAQVTVTVSDAFGQSSSTSFTWRVNALPALTAVTVPVTVGALPTPIDLATALKLTGGTAPYAWSCGTLPTGLVLTGGALSGTLPTLGTVRVPCTVTDARGKTAGATLTWSVLPALVVTTTTPVVAGVPTLVAAATGCSGTCTWAATGLPTGVTMNPATGQTAGRPPRGSFAVTVTATDAAARTTVLPVTWVVS